MAGACGGAAGRKGGTAAPDGGWPMERVFLSRSLNPLLLSSFHTHPLSHLPHGFYEEQLKGESGDIRWAKWGCVRALKTRLLSSPPGSCLSFFSPHHFFSLSQATFPSLAPSPACACPATRRPPRPGRTPSSSLGRRTWRRSRRRRWTGKRRGQGERRVSGARSGSGMDGEREREKRANPLSFLLTPAASRPLLSSLSVTSCSPSAWRCASSRPPPSTPPCSRAPTGNSRRCRGGGWRRPVPTGRGARGGAQAGRPGGRAGPGPGGGHQEGGHRVRV